jgi:hypothetical protein
MRPGNSRITAKGAGCNSTTLTSGTDRLSSLLGEAGPSLQPASSPANNRAITLLWSTERAVILLQPLRCCPQACAVGVRNLPRRQSALVPAPFLVSGFASSPGLGDRQAYARASRILLFLSSRSIARRNAKGVPGGSGKAARASQAGSGRGRSLATSCWDKSDISVLRQALRRLSAMVREGLFGCDEESSDLSAMG